MSASWQNTGTFPDSRTGGSMVKLPNGKVLYAGGYNGSFMFLSTCALFDPGPKTWAYTGSMAAARGQASMLLLNSGLVLIIGGNNGTGNALSSCELYDPNAGTWSSTGSLNTARTRMSAFLLGNGTVLVAGGGPTTGGSGFSSAEIYTPGSGTWVFTGSLPAATFGALFGMLGDGRPLMVGGINNGGSSPGTQTVTFSGGVWTSRAAAPIGFYGNDTNPAATLPSGDIVFMCPELTVSPFGASTSSYIYRVGTDTWATISSPNPPHAGSPYVLTNGDILLAGGLQPNPGSNLSSDRTDVLSHIAETWTQVANLPYAGELTATAGMLTAPVLDDGTPLWACPEINGGTTPTSNSSLLYEETITMAETKITGSQIQDATVGPTQLASTAVTPGSYTSTNLTVDADGRITAASNGSGGSASIVQKVQASFTAGSSNSSSSFTNTNITATITPTSASNLIKITCVFNWELQSGASEGLFTINGTANGNLAGGTNGFVACYFDTTLTDLKGSSMITWYDSPGTTSAQTYTLRSRNQDNTSPINTGDNNRVAQVIILEEIHI